MIFRFERYPLIKYGIMVCMTLPLVYKTMFSKPLNTKEFIPSESLIDPFGPIYVEMIYLHLCFFLTSLPVLIYKANKFCQKLIDERKEKQAIILGQYSNRDCEQV